MAGLLKTLISTFFLQACDGTQKVTTSASQRTKSGGPKPADHMFVGGKIEGPFVPGAAPSHMPVHVGAGPVVMAGHLSLMPRRQKNTTCQNPEGQAGCCLLLLRSKCQGCICNSASSHCSEHLRRDLLKGILCTVLEEQGLREAPGSFTAP